MKALSPVLLLLLLAVTLTLPVAAESACDCCVSKVEHCSKVVSEVCLTLKYQPRCFNLARKCLTPMDSCACPMDLPCTCHKPLAPMDPCAVEVCPEPVCHKPLVTAYPKDPCECATHCSCSQ